jgi:biopolymer transport protein ExbD
MKLTRVEAPKARIEIIPMIDAIFFLLVFFMMTSLSMVTINSKKVELPESSRAKLSADVKNKVIVSVAKNGDYYVNQDKVEEKQILPLLVGKLKSTPDMAVIINCDKSQQVGRFSRVFDLIKQANASNVMVATTPKDPAQLAAPPAAH